MNKTTDFLQYPVFFERNRVFRVYRGGKLFHDFFGDPPEDGNEPEEWVASSVTAMNRVMKSEFDGVSKLEGKEIYFNRLLEEFPYETLGGRESLGILVKLLDSAIRLPVQVHPDKSFSRRYLNSSYGKEEFWLVIATRPDAKIYFGFRKPLTKERFWEAVEASETDPEAMAEILNEIPVQPGDLFMIPARVVHAIGSGCLILEVQEPTDFIIQPEAWCGDYRLNDFEKYLNLDVDTALDCFDFSLSGQSVIDLGKKEPKIVLETEDLLTQQLIGPESSSSFRVFRHSLTGGELHLANAPAVYIVTVGEGQISKGEYLRALKKGDYFFLPYAARENCVVKGNLELVECISSEK